MESITNNPSIKEFFTDEYSALKNYVRSRIDETVDAEAEDIIQDVAVRLFSRPLDAVPINNIPGFVYSALKNRVIDVMRGKKIRIRGEKEIEALWTDFAASFYSGSELSYTEELKTILKIEINELKPAYRDIILAMDFEGYSYREISEETGISQGTLMSRRHRAISLLLKKLEKHKNYAYEK
ncbi:RNA polymerase sigma-54 factor RpoN [Croceitalea dokdonensis DOKDO 023]|uniref:RNA polymerase sigma-54 factor RpoN n=1 Tax=Croceitalea dokdonensis DOKDO 023 TaxID=1300341 RepID=A0A0P7AZK9_9FLAO|nr:RNA polymerase sigma factor [Croceitalea dokdonensis]KPM32011.1 RNA polymerase sigma-54 factor RpoN [Croceitalea dokdonensis DOKDO 023]